MDVLEQWEAGGEQHRLVVEKDGSLSVQFRLRGQWKYCSTGKQCTVCLSTMPLRDEEKEPETSAPPTVVSTLCVDYEPVTFAATFVGPEPEQDEPELALGNYPAPDRRKTVGEKVGDFFFKLSEWADGWRF